MAGIPPPRGRDVVPIAETGLTEAQVAKSGGARAEETDTVLAAARVLVALSARAVATIEGTRSPPQLRVLAMVSRHGELNLVAVARGLGVHPSNATRACDRLVAAGLLSRREDPADRRNLLLTLTGEGERLVESVLAHRRRAVEEILARMPADRRAALVPALRAFTSAAGEVTENEVWQLGWPG
jgi:DNA-binding MarR family transcriptional regulator